MARRRRPPPRSRAPWLLPVGLTLAALTMAAALLLASGGTTAAPDARHSKGSAVAPIVVEEWGDFG